MEHDLADHIESFLAKLDVLSDDGYFRQAIAFYVLREVAVGAAARLGVGRYLLAEHLEGVAGMLREPAPGGEGPRRRASQTVYEDDDAPVA